MSPDPAVRVHENEESPDHYSVKTESLNLSGYSCPDHEDFQYALSWGREDSRDPDELLSEVSGVFIYGNIEVADDDSTSEAYRDFFDLDEDRWGVDFWDEIVDVLAPSKQKLTSDTLVELYSETADIGEETAYQLLEALQEELP